MSEQTELTVATTNSEKQPELSDEQDGLAKPIFKAVRKLAIQCAMKNKPEDDTDEIEVKSDNNSTTNIQGRQVRIESLTVNNYYVRSTEQQTPPSTSKKPLEPKVSVNTKIKIQQALKKCEEVDSTTSAQIDTLPKSDV